MIFNLLKKLKDDPRLNIIALSFNEGPLTEKLRIAGIDTHVISESRHSFVQIYLKALRFYRKYKIDIIHSHRFKENVLAILLSKFLGAQQLFVTLHGLPEPQLKIRRGPSAIGVKTWLNFFLLQTFFTKIIAVSHEMKAVLVRQYSFKEDAVEVIHNGIPLPQEDQRAASLQYQQKNEGNDRFICIGSVGRLVPVKDYDLFLDIAAAMKQKSKRGRFSILGDGPLKEQLRSKAARLDILDCVVFHSSRVNPFPYYSSLDIYLNTSLHEGIPLSILEAMACGKPVVAPRVGGISEIINNGKNGILVDERRAELFVEACLRLIEDHKYRKDISANARKQVESQFNDVSMANSYSMLYQE
jgi:glycosyltransferase involved in cell wall biosynthesis